MESVLPPLAPSGENLKHQHRASVGVDPPREGGARKRRKAIGRLTSTAIATSPRPLRSTQAQPTAHCNLGWTYEAIGDERQAVAHYRKTLELDPSLEGSGRQSQAVVGNARAAALSANEV